LFLEPEQLEELLEHDLHEHWAKRSTVTKDHDVEEYLRCMNGLYERYYEKEVEVVVEASTRTAKTSKKKEERRKTRNIFDPSTVYIIAIMDTKLDPNTVPGTKTVGKGPETEFKKKKAKPDS
jgi:hypothetical protein